MVTLHAFLSFLPRAPKFPLPRSLLTPATQAIGHMLNLAKICYYNPFPLHFRQGDPYKDDRAPLKTWIQPIKNMNSKVFFGGMTAVWTVKTQRKRISSHLKNRNPTKPIRYKLVCEQNVFSYRLIIQNHFNLLFIERCSFCSSVCCYRLLLRCSRWISSRCSRSRGFRWKISLGEDVEPLIVLVCHLHWKLFMI